MADEKLNTGQEENPQRQSPDCASEKYDKRGLSENPQ